MKHFISSNALRMGYFLMPLFQEQYKEISISARKYLLFLVGITGAYVFSALLGFEFASINNNVSMIWIPAGIALVAILHYGYRYWPAVLLGAIISNIISGTGVMASIGIAFGNTAEVLVVYGLLNYFYKSCLICSLETPRHVVGFVVAVACGALVAALNGSVVLSLLVFKNWDQFYEVMSVWWLGDAMGMILIAPFLLIWLQPQYDVSFREVLKNIFLFSIIILALFISFGGLFQIQQETGVPNTQYPLAFIPMAALLIVALFSGPKFISLAIICSTGFIIISTLSGYGPFVRTEFEESMLLTYLFISISTIGAFSLSYMVRQKNMAQEEARVGAERLDFVMQGTEDGVWDWDIETNEVYVSPTLKKMLGYSDHELTGNLDDWKKRLHPEDREQTLNLLNDHYGGKSDIFQSEFRFLCKDGEYLWVLGRGKKVKYTANNNARRIVGTCVDLSAQKKKEAKLELASQVIESTPEGVMITSPDNTIVDVNPAFTKTTGYCRDEVIGQKPSFLSSGRHEKAFYQKMWASIEAEGFWQGEVWNRRKNGEIFPEWMHISSIRGADDRVVQYAAIFSDIGNQEHLKKELHNFAYYDALTDLPNRDLLIDRLNIALSQARTNNEQSALLLIDLDRFKIINETLGHSVGDALLQEVSTIINSVIGENDTLARMGGDEFSILLPVISSMDEIDRVAKDILGKFVQPHMIHEHELHISCSIGISVYPQDGESAEELIKNSDTAMYRAKEEGFNKYNFYHSDMSATFQESFLLESQLRNAVERDELFLEYQPQHDINTGRIIGMEALVRWRHPELGTIPPYKFISIAEDTGLILPIGEWIIKQAVHDACSILDKVDLDFKVAINLSVLQLLQKEFTSYVSNVAENAGLPYRHLELEITESVFMKNMDDVLVTLNELAGMGIHISIDDFGTGYSSLSYLKKFPISKLKIDKSFVDDVCVNKDDAEIASTIIAMGHNLHMKVIAEGVEDIDQKNFLQSKGCDEVQGYHYSRPLMFDKLIEYLESNKHMVNKKETVLKQEAARG